MCGRNVLWEVPGRKAPATGISPGTRFVEDLQYLDQVPKRRPNGTTPAHPLDFRLHSYDGRTGNYVCCMRAQKVEGSSRTLASALSPAGRCLRGLGRRSMVDTLLVMLTLSEKLDRGWASLLAELGLYALMS